MEFKLVGCCATESGQHELRYEVEFDGFLLEDIIIEEYINRSSLHPFKIPFGYYNVEVIDDTVYLTHQYDTSD